MKLFFNYFFFLNITCATLFLVCSCNKKAVEIPKGILTKQELVPVLADMHLAQAAAGLNQFSDTARYNLNEYSDAIFGFIEFVIHIYGMAIHKCMRHP